MALKSPKLNSVNSISEDFVATVLSVTLDDMKVSTPVAKNENRQNKMKRTQQKRDKAAEEAEDLEMVKPID